MKKNIKIQFIFLSLLFTASLHAQVTIGSTEIPEPAALLQIKEHEAVSGSETAEKGILLPRVKLTDLSDITVIPDSDPDKIADLTGLLVYNVNTSGMKAGIYEWDGQEWVPLEILAEDEGAYIKKALVQTSSLTDDNAPTVNVGRFSFRFSPNKQAQCKMNTSLSANETLGFHIARFWELKDQTTGSYIGYTYDAQKLNFTSDNYSTWKNLHSAAMNGEERWDVWLADTLKNKVYNVQFIIFTKITPTYIVLVTEY
jgi:hypothetical protein